MRRLITLLMVTAMSVVGWAQSFSVGMLNYNVTSTSTAEVTGLSTTGQAQGTITLTIPSTVTYNSNSYTVTTIASQAFLNNANLYSITFPSTLTQIGMQAFQGSTKLYSVTIPAGSIAEMAFFNCTALKKLTLDGVTGIKANAFGACTGLTAVTLPASLPSITLSAFSGCSSLRNILVDENNANLSSYNGNLYNKSQTTLYRVPEGKSGSASTVFSSNVVTVYNSAFSNAAKITSIAVPYGVTSIGTMAFESCTAATVIEIPGSVKSLGTYVFQRCTGLTDLYINTDTAFVITKANMFLNAANPNLHVKRDLTSTFSSAGWTDFASVNQDTIVPADAYLNSVGFTVTSTADTTINGTTYSGTCEVVRSRWNYALSGSHTVPAHITLRGKNYAVTRIDNYAYNTQSRFSVSGCVNVTHIGEGAFMGTPITNIDMPNVKYVEALSFCNCTSITSVVLPKVISIRASAFRDCSSLTSAIWGSRLRYIYGSAFENAPLTNDIILPPKTYVTSRAFYGVKSKLLVVPYLLPSDGGIRSDTFHGMESLETIVFNRGPYYSANIFKDTPSSCKILVPVGRYNDFKSNTSWSRFNIEEGAFDFARDNDINSPYKITVTIASEGVDDDGETYAGAAKYVYSPSIKGQGITTYDARASEVQSWIDEDAKYMMIGFGDSCLVGSEVNTLDFTKMNMVYEIGRKAFYGTKLKKAEMPDGTPVTFGVDAFTDATELSELVVTRRGFTCSSKFFGNNAEDFNFYVDYADAYEALNTLKYYKFSDTEMCCDRVAINFTAKARTMALGTFVPLKFDTDSYKAFVVYGGDESTGVARTTSVKWVPAERGVLLAGLNEGQLYKIPRYTGSTANSTTNYLIPTSEDLNIYNTRDAYYWDTATNTFIMPTWNKYVGAGGCYLKLSGDATSYTVDLGDALGVKGDVNGDGIVDITDVNLAINMVLGKADKSTAADIDGSGDVDITDVNAIINLMLGK